MLSLDTNNFALNTLLLSASSDLGISITSSPSISLSTRSLSDETMSFGWHKGFLDSYSIISVTNLWKNGTVLQQQNILMHLRI